MKKFLAFLTAAVLACCVLSVCAAEESRLLEPYADTDMEALGQDYTVRATCLTDGTDEKGLDLMIFGKDLYSRADVLALRPGDRIFANGAETVVEKIDEVEGGIDINGGYLENNDGVSLFALPDDPDTLCSCMEDDYISSTFLGEAYEPFAEQIRISVYSMDEEGNPLGGYDETVLRPEEVRPFIQRMYEDSYIEFNYSVTTVTVQNGAITEIRVDYAP